jgi:hypothetical protein
MRPGLARVKQHCTGKEFYDRKMSTELAGGNRMRHREGAPALVPRPSMN